MSYSIIKKIRRIGDRLESGRRRSRGFQCGPVCVRRLNLWRAYLEAHLGRGFGRRCGDAPVDSDIVIASKCPWSSTDLHGTYRKTNMFTTNQKTTIGKLTFPQTNLKKL